MLIKTILLAAVRAYCKVQVWPKVQPKISKIAGPSMTISTWTTTLASIRLRLHGAIYRPDSFILMLRYCANVKAIRYESKRLNRIVADKSHLVIVA